MTERQRVDTTRSKRGALNRDSANRRTWSAIDARRRLDASLAGSVSSAARDAGRSESRYAYLGDRHD